MGSMLKLEDCHDPGVLLVVSKPTAPEHLNDVHDWYDHEHGPARLRLGEGFFTTGLRYRSMEKDPVWLAMYDMKNLSAGANPVYTGLRQNRSSREKGILQHKVNVLSRQFLRLEASSGASVEAPPALCCIGFETDSASQGDVVTWYRKNVFSILEAEMRCSRSRFFLLVDGTEEHEARCRFIGIHDLAEGSQGVERQVLELVGRALDSNVLITPGASLKSFVLHREMRAEDYTGPSQSLGDAKQSERADANSKL